MTSSQPKNLNRSLRDKYNRRIKLLSHAVEQFEIAANDRLNIGGNIRNRSEIEAILAIVSTLKPHLPDTSSLDDATYKRLCDLFDMAYDPPVEA